MNASRKLAGILTAPGWIITAACALTTSAALAQSPAKHATGPLRVHPTNPRYFTDGAGKAIYLTGSHTWNSLQDGAFFTTENADPPPAFDFNAYLDFLQRHNHNFIRLWRFELPKFNYWLDIDNHRLRGPASKPGIQFSQPHPWPRVGPGAALDGKPKFDLSRFDPAYFERLRSRVIAARDRGIYVSVMLFEGGAPRATNKPWRRDSHPFHRRNNINGVEVDANNNGEGIEFHTLRTPVITELQRAYIHHVVDTVNDLDNVLYEVGNEFASSVANTRWQYWVVRCIKEYETTKPRQHPVGMVCAMHHPWKNGGSGDPRNAVLLDGPADWVSPGNQGGRGYDDNTAPPPADGGKVILLDTDHLWGMGGDRAWVWKSFVRGHNPIFMDALSEITEHTLKYPQAPEIRTALGQTRAFSEKMNLAMMTPRGELASTQYCLASPGKEYLIYLPDGGEVTVDLSQGAEFFAVKWFDPRTGKDEQGKPVKSGGKVALQAPFEGDAVLYLRGVQL
ncbi:MAG: hypothetical protein JNM65_16845 [Verrucomicrobiaceae bacterium]|nr:hypothetical protein [Verrucomicrobiaceae bacterium]